MQIPFDFWNISLWLALASAILLITVQLVSSYDGASMLLIDQKKLKTATLATALCFLITVAIRMYGIVSSR